MKIRFAVLFLSVLLLPVPSAAQQEAGDTELEFTGSLITTVGSDETWGIGIVQSKLGQFVTDRWEFGAFPSLEVRLGETTDTRFGFGLFATYSYLRPDAMTAPYVGASYYKNDLTERFSANDSWLGVNAGLKFYVSPDVAVDVGGDYQFGLQGQEGGLFILRTGLSFLF